MRRSALALIAIGLFAVAQPARADIGDYLGKPVVTVRAEAEGAAVTDPAVLELIATKAGAELTMADVRETIAHLVSLRRYEDVRVQAGAAAGGVALVYDLVPVHAVNRITFDGVSNMPGIDTGRLRRTLVDRYGPSPSVGRVPDLVRIIEDQLNATGYLHPAVKYRVEDEHTPHRATLAFEIAPGPRTTIGDVTVIGDAGMPEAQLLSRLRIEKGRPFERDAMNIRIDELREKRRADGYVGANVSVTTAFEPGDRVVDLTVRAEQGLRVRLVFRGDPLPRDKQTDLVPIVEEGSADADLLEDSTDRIERYFHGLGYRDARAPHTREEANGELIVTFTISRGALYKVSEVTVTGATFVSSTDLERQMQVRIGQPYSEAQIESDLSAIEDGYRRQGFANAQSSFAAEPMPGTEAEVPVAIRVTIDERKRTTVGSVRFEGNTSIPGESLREDLGLRPGVPFFLTQMAIDRDAIQLRYANLGYQNASVGTNPGLSPDLSRADVVFTIVEGPQVFVDHVLIAGNVRTKTATIERELQLHSGEPLGLSAIVESQRRLASLGLFRRARITQLGHGDETRRDILVTVEEAPVTTLGYGGGLEVGQRVRADSTAGGAAISRLEAAPRAFFEIGRRNLWDKNRSISLFTRVSLRPDDAISPDDDLGEVVDGGGYGFSEYRVIGSYREPRVLGTPADAYLTTTFEQQARSSFSFERRAFTAEVGRRLSPAVSLLGSYQIQHTRLFNERINPADRLLIDRLFPQIRLSSFSMGIVESTRDDVVDPTRGRYLSAIGELAAERIGSEVGYVKSFLTAQVFHTVPRSRGWVFAGSARLGMATGFARTVLVSGSDGEPIIGPDGEPVTQVVRDLPASERFFAGGDTTVRGFALDQLGAPDTLDQDGFALGGNASLILNAELRMPLRGSIGMVGFFDTGNVYSRTTNIDLGELRSAVGVGVRYRSPVGPLRIDVGFKLDRREVVPGVRETPAAIHISLGQAF